MSLNTSGERRLAWFSHAGYGMKNQAVSFEAKIACDLDRMLH